MARTPPGTRDAYGAFRAVPTRWMDNDAYGHLNNATYLSFIDTAVSLWQMDHGIQIQGPEAARFLVIETGIRYHSEMGFPDIIHAGLRLGHLGTSSLRFEVGLFRNDDTTASAEGFFAQVLVDDTNRPAPIPERLRTVFEALNPV